MTKIVRSIHNQQCLPEVKFYTDDDSFNGNLKKLELVLYFIFLNGGHSYNRKYKLHCSPSNLLYLVLGHVRASILDSDSSLDIVELASIELEELDEQYSQVVRLSETLGPRVQLQEADAHEDERVGRNASREHLV